MSWRRAPIYVRAADLSRWIHERLLSRRRDSKDLGLERELAAEVRSLVADVSLALTFPADRAEHQRSADERVVRLRVHLRLAEEIGLLTARHLRHAAAELEAIGRMLGGWRKSTRLRRSKRRGVEAPAAPPASCAAAATGTTPTGAGPPSGTGTTPGTAGTTSDSGSSFRPPNPRPPSGR